MYFTYGWPRILRVPEADPPSPVSQVSANRDRIIFAVITHSTLSIWTSKPCLPVVSHQRSQKSVKKLGQNVRLIWKPDSTSIVIATAGGYLMFYGLGTGNKTLFEQVDPDSHKLRRESDELFLKEPIPAITIQLLLEVAVRGRIIGSVTLFRDELMVSTDENSILRYRWDGTINRDFCIDLRRVPFSVDQHASRAVPIQESNVYPIDFHYSPTIGGLSLVLSDGRAAFLTATTKVYDPNSVQGIWAPNLDDVTCSCVSHKYRLLSFGRKNAETAVYSVDDQTGGLQYLFSLKLSSRDFPGCPGPVRSMAWTPDGCALAISWEKGGFALWSVFGSLLTCSWSWAGDLSPFSQKIITSFDWAAEGYQLWMAVEPNLCVTSLNNVYSTTYSCQQQPVSASPLTLPDVPEESPKLSAFGVLSFVKSALTVNPGMSQIEHLYLQGEDRLLVNFSSDSITSTGAKNSSSFTNPNLKSSRSSKSADVSTPLGNNKNWVVIPIPDTYLATNWPIRYTAMDPEGLHIAVSGRYGLAHYSIVERKWKLFGNEAQEHDFVVVGGMMWWDAFLVVAVYDIAQDRDELRFYPRDSKLDNKFVHAKRLPSQILLLSLDRDKLLTFAADSTLAIFQLKDGLNSEVTNPVTTGYRFHQFYHKVETRAKARLMAALTGTLGDPCECMQTIDVGALCVHPACVISVYLTTLKTSFSSSLSQQHSVVLNVSGRLMILHHEYLVQDNNHGNAPQYITPTVLASCVEMVWLPRGGNSSVANNAGTYSGANSSVANGTVNHNLYLSEALWLYCGQEMRVWLPLREKSQSSVHTFISNRIMLGFPVSIYPLTILFDKAIILGAENDSLSYTTGLLTSSDSHVTPNTLFAFCTLQRTTQVYLHQILRQLIRRNLGYYAWEIARSCSKLPYFPHSLELLLHEVLEEEATSKEPIPDALLPSVIEFVREFPVYLRTVGQCARKTELALWPHLFSVAGRPRALFDECLQRGQLDIAATYLLVIQNLESPTVSRKFATQLMDKALENKKLDLVKDLVRFLKAIDPSDIEPVRASIPKFNTQTPPISPSEYDISMVLGTMQVPRMRSLSTSVVPKFPELSHRDLSRANSDNRGSTSVTPSPSQPCGSFSNQNSGQNASTASVVSPSQQTSPSIGLGAGGQQHSVTNSFYGEVGGHVSGFATATTTACHGAPDRDFSITTVAGGGDRGNVGVAYVDAIVERHARRILAEGKLRDLGKLAAHLDFQLVSWLRREKKRRPIMVTDFVAALKMIHSEFEWPYPDFVCSPCQHSRTPSTGGNIISYDDESRIGYIYDPTVRFDYRDSVEQYISDSIKYSPPEAASPLRPITVDILGNRLLANKISSRNGNDSGYNSTLGNQTDSRERDGSTMEARLVPNALIGLDDSLSVLSEESVLLDQSPLTSSDLMPVFNLTNSAKVTLLNSSKSGIELRFMQQIMWEAGVLDWSLLISIVLHDALGVVRTVNSSRDQSPDTLRNLGDGLLGMALWASSQCMGYKTFMNAINGQVGGVVAKYLANANQNHGQTGSGAISEGSHGELSRRRTEPLIGATMQTHSSCTSNCGGVNAESSSLLRSLTSVGGQKTFSSRRSFSSGLDDGSQQSHNDGLFDSECKNQADRNVHLATQDDVYPCEREKDHGNSLSSRAFKDFQNVTSYHGSTKEDDENQNSCILS